MPACASSSAAAWKAISPTQGAALASSNKRSMTGRALARIAAQAASSSSRLAAATSLRQVRTSTVRAASASLVARRSGMWGFIGRPFDRVVRGDVMNALFAREAKRFLRVLAKN
jgi:hypothetical protein